MTIASKTSARKDIEKKETENEKKDKATHDAPKKTNKTDKAMTDTTKRTPMKRPASAVLVVSDSKTPTKLEEGVMLWKKAKISCSDSKGGWRVWPDKSVVGKEKVFKYADDQDEAWNRVLSFLTK